jgi:hypothetical protein
METAPGALRLRHARSWSRSADRLAGIRAHAARWSGRVIRARSRTSVLRNRIIDIASKECPMSSSPPSTASLRSLPAQPGAASPAAPAVEVITMLGNSVVGVAHVEPLPAVRSRAQSRVALGVTAAIGALLLLLAALAFGKGLAAAAADEHALAHWRDVLGRPVYEFRPTRLHPAYDWMALLGLTGGMAALTWGGLGLRARPRRDTFTIGTDAGVDASVAGSSSVACPTRFELIRWRDGAPVVRVTGGMRARMHRDGRVYSIDELAALGVARSASEFPGAHELAVPESGSVRVEIGASPASFVIRKMAAGRKLALSGQAMPERRTLAFWLGSIIAHLALLALVSAIPPSPATLGLGLEGSETRIISARSKAFEVAPIETSSEPSSQPSGPRGPSATLALEPPSSAGGGPDVRNPDRQRTPGSREDARRQAQREGMLAFLGDRPGVFDPLGEIGSFEAEPGAVTDYGGPVGAGPGSNWGTFGSGPGGFALQGGGTVASGGYNTIGEPGGSGPFGPGGHGPGLDPRARARFSGPTVRISNPETDGGLDKRIIRSHVQRQHERIRHCYERTLLTSPDVAGTVVTSFVISPDGRVIRAGATGIGNAGLESCIAGVINNMSFPRSSSNQITQVTSYPFELRTPGR